MLRAAQRKAAFRPKRQVWHLLAFKAILRMSNIGTGLDVFLLLAYAPQKIYTICTKHKGFFTHPLCKKVLYDELC